MVDLTTKPSREPSRAYRMENPMEYLILPKTVGSMAALSAQSNVP
jgi:hypothetical protein